jgi:ankyrin repeat protein
MPRRRRRSRRAPSNFPSETTYTTTIDMGPVNLVTDNLKLRATMMCDLDALRAYISEGGDLEDSGAFRADPDPGSNLKPVTFLQSMVILDCAEGVQLLLNAGAAVNAIDLPDGYTAMMDAAQYGYTDCLRLLLDAGGDVDVQRGNGSTALMLATSAAEESSVRQLLRRGANYSTHNGQGNSALALCAATGSLSMIKLYQECGADVSVTESNPEGRAAFIMAAREGWVDLMTYLLRETVPPDSSMGAILSDALCSAAAEGHQHAVHFLVRYGADVNSSGSSGATPLSAAEQRGHRDVVKQLLAAGAKKDTAATASASSGAKAPAVVAAPAAAAMTEVPTLVVSLPVTAATVSAEAFTATAADASAGPCLGSGHYYKDSKRASSSSSSSNSSSSVRCSSCYSSAYSNSRRKAEHSN